jgi:hypothetical protein
MNEWLTGPSASCADLGAANPAMSDDTIFALVSWHLVHRHRGDVPGAPRRWIGRGGLSGATDRSTQAGRTEAAIGQPFRRHPGSRTARGLAVGCLGGWVGPPVRVRGDHGPRREVSVPGLNLL